MSKGWVGVDLDGTLAHYDGWKGLQNIGKPISPMVKRVQALLGAGLEVKIFTARANIPEQIPPVEKWCLEHIGVILPVTSTKDFNMITLYDDRCVQVEKNTGRLLGGEECP